ncbi:MAG: hypothetical protein C0501_29650 [Isosphaera sp.]|nr:hypothetical protein [Isosphaera sp.]
MPRLLALLLMLPPTLMPPGMCVCRLIPGVPSPTAPRPAPTAHQLPAPHAENPRPDCSCESCRSRPTPAAPESDDTPSPHDRPTDPGPGKHWPGCPAVDAAPLSMVVPAVTVPADLVAPATFSTLLAGAAASPARVEPLRPPATARPLFISHCALLI